MTRVTARKLSTGWRLDWPDHPLQIPFPDVRVLTELGEHIALPVRHRTTAGRSVGISPVTRLVGRGLVLRDDSGQVRLSKHGHDALHAIEEANR